MILKVPQVELLLRMQGWFCIQKSTNILSLLTEISHVDRFRDVIQGSSQVFGGKGPLTQLVKVLWMSTIFRAKAKYLTCKNRGSISLVTLSVSTQPSNTSSSL